MHQQDCGFAPGSRLKGLVGQRCASHSQSYVSQGCMVEGHPHPHSDVAGFVLHLWCLRVCFWPRHGFMCHILAAFPSQACGAVLTGPENDRMG